jgi:enterochelin esterase-like enzyme
MGDGVRSRRPAWPRAAVVVTALGLVALSAVAGAQASATARRVAPPLQWMTPVAEAPRVSYRTFESAAVGARVSYHLYTPAAYERDPARRFPVVYWLHGSGGGVQGIPQLADLVDEAIEAGQLPPVLVVFVNGLRLGMYVDWKDGRAPIETMIVRELVPHIDASLRTVATREGRLLDGFSMGGYGAARFGFKYPEMFRAVSIMGAGPMQDTLTHTPRASRKQVDELLQEVYGGDQTIFRAVSPRRLAADNAAVIARDSMVRMVIGSRDETFDNNVAFHDHLVGLGIPHEWIVVEGVGHDPIRLLRSLGDRHWSFYRKAFE